MKEKNRESCKQLVKIRNCGIVRRNKTYYKISGYRTGIRTSGAPLWEEVGWILEKAENTDSDEVKKTEVIRIFHLHLEKYTVTYFITFLAHQY